MTDQHHPATRRELGRQVEQIIYRSVDRAILSGELRPGTKLREEELSEIYQVPRSRVRSALHRLAHDEVVVLHANRGAFVAAPSIAEARSIFEARRVIEQATTEIATRMILTPHLRGLGQVIADTRAAMRRGDRPAAIEGIGRFPSEVSRIAGNPTLTRVLQQLITRSSLVVALYGSASRLNAIPSDQETILGIMTDGDSARAAREVVRHLYAIEADLELTPNDYEDLPTGSVLMRYVASVS